MVDRTNPRNQLSIGSDVEIAYKVSELLSDKLGQIVFTEGQFWFYKKTAWEPITTTTLERCVHGFDGATVGKSKVKLSAGRIGSIIHVMGTLVDEPEFFDNAKSGINCETGFIEFDEGGNPILTGHAPEHRCRHTLSAKWSLGVSAQPPEGSLLWTFLDGLFEGDEEREMKLAMLQEAAGAAIAALGTRLAQPKALILWGRSANNGKSACLTLVSGMLPSTACTCVSAGQFEDQHYRVALAGKLLNTSDELSSASAITSDIFKKIVSGDPVQARDLYKPVISFRSRAQHIFATNRLPPFMGGFDRGCQRRLLVVKFDSSIDAEKMIAAIGDRILDEESDLMLAWAIAGASRLIRQGGFSTCPSSIAALRDWLHDADPVKMWTAERVREGETPEVINQAGYVRPEIYGFFTHWAEENGYRKDRLPGSPEFFNRLAEDYPIIVKRTAGSRRIRGITVLLTDEDGQKTPRDISEIVEPYRNATAAGLLRPPGSAAYVNENGNPVWGEELDVALRRTVN